MGKNNLRHLMVLLFVVLLITPMAYGGGNISFKPIPPTSYTDMTYSFLQVVSPTTIRLRNILISTNGLEAFYRADFNLDKKATWTMVPNSLRLEGTNQRTYIIGRSTGDLLDPTNLSAWDEISSAFPGVKLARDDNFLYILMASWETGTWGTGMHCFQARTLPEDDSFSLYTCAVPPLDPFGLYSVQKAVHFRGRLTEPVPSLEPGAAIVANYYPGDVMGGGPSGFTGWRVPLSSDEWKAIDGKYVDAWVDRSQTGSRDVTTNSQEGVRIILAP